jgi:mycothiol system anti-sigma-R factor
MSHCGHDHEITCEEISNALYIYLDHEIQDPMQLQQLQIHFQDCPPCKGTMEQEKQALELLRALLHRSCNEEAPADLKQQIFAQTQSLAEQMNAILNAQLPETHIYSEYIRTEITVDGVTQIVETSHEIRRDFPL